MNKDIKFKTEKKKDPCKEWQPPCLYLLYSQNTEGKAKPAISESYPTITPSGPS